MKKISLIGFPTDLQSEWETQLEKKGVIPLAGENLFKALEQNPEWVLLYVPPQAELNQAVVLGFNQDSKQFVSPLDINQVIARITPQPIFEEKLDWDLINAFIDATKEVLTMMVGIEVEKKELLLKNKKDKIWGDVSSVIGFTGVTKLNGDINGSVALTLPMDLAKKLIAAMLVMDESELQEDDIYDGVGELINMISGDAKSKYGNTFKISLPTVITGYQHTVGGTREIKGVVVKFQAPEDSVFYLQISLEETKK
ncbi:MAG: chemotaxis protein CheX [Candidatus Desulfofervidaceae bacterium]|nr:chemotaxis protein CheX [Candidatus Desulfofervidaceae bacterium]